MKAAGIRSLTLGLMIAAPLTVLSLTAAAGSQAVSREAKIQITVRVFNRVHVPPDRLAEAEQVATQILGHARVQALWFDCSITGETGEEYPGCDRPLGPTDLILNFVEEIQSLSPKMKGITLGLALGVAGDGRGDKAYCAYISNRRAHDVARECAASPGMILGLAAAHEIGHLLMSAGDHSGSGLMRACWDVKDLVRAARGDLRFTDDQVMQLIAGVRARIARQNAVQVDATVSH